VDIAAIVTGIRARLEPLLAPPRGSYRPFVVADRPVGWLDPERARHLAAVAEALVVTADGVRFAAGIDDAATRTAALERIARTLAQEHLLSAWRNERYAVVADDASVPLFELERAAARYFGIATSAVHVNGLVAQAGGAQLWFARRSAHKAIDPGLLDNLVGGGIAAGADVVGTMVKEAWEEAGIAPDIAARAVAVGTLSVCREQRDGLQRETIHVHDLWLDDAFAPVANDGEVTAFRRVPVAEAARLVANRDGPDVVTADASLVVVDCLIRQGVIPPGGADFRALDAMRRTPLDLNRRR
jgi:8-oxo-dGTP pyrophosphatase MutT (NUDIX family)